MLSQAYLTATSRRTVGWIVPLVMCFAVLLGAAAPAARGLVEQLQQEELLHRAPVASERRQVAAESLAAPTVREQAAVPHSAVDGSSGLGVYFRLAYGETTRRNGVGGPLLN